MTTEIENRQSLIVVTLLSYEVQGTTREVAIHKCQQAADTVLIVWFRLVVLLLRKIQHWHSKLWGDCLDHTCIPWREVSDLENGSLQRLDTSGWIIYLRRIQIKAHTLYAHSPILLDQGRKLKSSRVSVRLQYTECCWCRAMLFLREGRIILDGIRYFSQKDGTRRLQKWQRRKRME